MKKRVTTIVRIIGIATLLAVFGAIEPALAAASCNVSKTTSQVNRTNPVIGIVANTGFRPSVLIDPLTLVYVAHDGMGDGTILFSFRGYGTLVKGKHDVWVAWGANTGVCSNVVRYLGQVNAV